MREGTGWLSTLEIQPADSGQCFRLPYSALHHFQMAGNNFVKKTMSRQEIHANLYMKKAFGGASTGSMLLKNQLFSLLKCVDEACLAWLK